ncbi:hypothetical protein [Helicobacter ailurogastricus]|uniref:Lipoprotein n=1 Tax=Helicobacter ailurogastricus TaxID=1578720 RepID=A0A0K2XZU8_9HELI|nr:hypothetical protein [Helicobacter ailurogastricus]CRF40713.1 hypothetical protein HAL011_04750 [Helicobacter ailurogastricus]CRF43106.1 hypothetical protein HAL013_13300 [Helicobacter ailurogastricus]CRF44335.1 hypothetical protein HAL09_09110 [Helicobacter ailurogastricus]CRF52193.1 hypothetical protein HAL07_03190 [Helicobacter ailurogastricus]BDQ29312.1 hypothetical protein ASB7_11490 [Helicobacter ailurogastricus]
MQARLLCAAFCAVLLMTGCASDAPTKSAAPSKSATAKKAPAPAQSAQQNDDDDDDINYERQLIRGKK